MKNILLRLGLFLFVVALLTACSGGTTTQPAINDSSYVSAKGGNTEFLTAVSSSSDNGRFVAVGGNGTANGGILTSSDGIIWSPESSAITTPLTGVAYGGGIFAAVGFGGQVFTSKSGDSWSSAQTTDRSNSDLRAITYANNQFVAVGNNGVVITYDPTGSGQNSWTTQTSNTTNPLFAVTNFPTTSSFIAVGANGTILNSKDAINWITESSSTTETILGVAANSSIAVAVGANGLILTSLDGINWQLEGNAGINNNLTGVSYCNGQFIITSERNGVVLVSTDGKTWNQQAIATNNKLYGITSMTNGAVVMVGEIGTIVTNILNNFNFTSITSPSSSQFNNIIYAPDKNLFVTVGESIIVTYPFTYESGLGTPVVNNSFPYAFNAITYANGVFVAVGNDGAIETSPDGMNWTYNTQNAVTNPGDLYDISYSGGVFTAVGVNSILITSDPLSDSAWINQFASSTPMTFNGISSNNGQDVVVGIYYGSGYYYGSSYFTTNPPETWPFGPLLIGSTTIGKIANSISYGLSPAFNHGVFVTVTESGTIYSIQAPVPVPTSFPIWFAPASPTSNSLNRIIYSTDRFIAVGNDGTIITSNDAQNWSANPVSGTQNNLNGVACSGGIGGICVLVGDSGEIATAPQTLKAVNK